jgi:CheY-like chemotaxis protein
MKKRYYFILVDDCTEDAAHLKEKLAQLKLENDLTEFRSGDEAHAYLSSRLASKFHLPNLIFLNLGSTPETDLEFLRKIKNDETLKHIPVIVMSVNKEPAYVVKAYKLGASFFMAKSSDKEILQEVINQLQITGQLKMTVE